MERLDDQVDHAILLETALKHQKLEYRRKEVSEAISMDKDHAHMGRAEELPSLLGPAPLAV